MSANVAAPVPYLVCCGLLLPWEYFDESWCASCWRCGRDFLYTDPEPSASTVHEESDEEWVS